MAAKADVHEKGTGRLYEKVVDGGLRRHDAEEAAAFAAMMRGRRAFAPMTRWWRQAPP